mgnify:CR=1 FL=1
MTYAAHRHYIAFLHHRGLFSTLEFLGYYTNGTCPVAKHAGPGISINMPSRGTTRGDYKVWTLTLRFLYLLFGPAEAAAEAVVDALLVRIISMSCSAVVWPFSGIDSSSLSNSCWGSEISSQGRFGGRTSSGEGAAAATGGAGLGFAERRNSSKSLTTVFARPAISANSVGLSSDSGTGGRVA